METPVETKMEAPVEAKVEQRSGPTVMSKLSRRAEEKPSVKEGKVEVSVPAEKEQSKKEQDSKVIENANYLTNILEIRFSLGYDFSQKFPLVSKEELLELYFAKK